MTFTRHIQILLHRRLTNQTRFLCFNQQQIAKELGQGHSRPQRPRSFWSAPRIVTSGQVQYRTSTIRRLPVILRMLRIKSDKSDWFWSQSIVFIKPFKTRMSLDLARGPDFQRMTKRTPGDEAGVRSHWTEQNSNFWMLVNIFDEEDFIGRSEIQQGTGASFKF